MAPNENSSLLGDIPQTQRSPMTKKWLVVLATLIVMSYIMLFRGSTQTGSGNEENMIMGQNSNGMVGGDRDSHGEMCGIVIEKWVVM